MNTVSMHTCHARTDRVAAERRAAIAPADFSRANVAGPFSLLTREAIRIEAEAGLVIRVQAGCLWVPHEGLDSIGVGVGEQWVVERAGALTALATFGTQVELKWPDAEGSSTTRH